MVSIKKLTILGVAILAMLSFSPISSFAQKIGVVDGQKVLDGYSEYQNANTKLNGIVKSWQDTLSMMNKALQEKFEGYQKIVETMSKDAKAKADDELKKMNAEISNYQAVKSNPQDGEIVKLRADLMKPIVDKVKNAIGMIAKKKKLDIIVDKGNIAFVAEGVTDITDDVSSALKK